MTNVKRTIDGSHGDQPAPHGNFTAYLMYPLMSLSLSPPVLPPPDTAVLLVLLPLGRFGETGPNALSTVSIRALQTRLGPNIRVLQVDEASHPAVVRSFGTPELPACVLMRQGVELWRQHGLPEDEAVFNSLLEAAQAV
jgi:hypothetical protein